MFNATLRLRVWASSVTSLAHHLPLNHYHASTLTSLIALLISLYLFYLVHQVSMPPTPNEELSLRHLPDMSDTSFSFKIPGGTQEIDLLADDGLDFFHGIDVSCRVPPYSPQRANDGPMTINDLTPGPVSFPSSIQNPETTSPSRSGSMVQSRNKRSWMYPRRPELSKLRKKVMSNPRPVMPLFAHLQPTGGTSSAAHTSTLRADIDTFTGKLHTSPLSPIDQEPTEADIQGSKGARKESLEKNLAPPSRRREKQPRNKQVSRPLPCSRRSSFLTN